MKRFIFVTNLSVATLIFALAGCVTKPPAASHARSEPQAHSAALNLPADVTKPPEPAAPGKLVKEPAGILSLRQALALALSENPALAPFAWQARANEARILQAGLRLNPELGLLVEDIAGTGSFSGARETQTTLQLKPGHRTRRQTVRAHGSSFASTRPDDVRV